jgi:hypothetical protein
MKKIFITFSLLIFVLSLSGQTLEYHIQKPQKLYVGTPFHVVVDITSSLQDSIFAPQIDTLDIFILKDINSSEEIEKDEVKTNIDFTFQPFDTGEFTFPELEFAVKSADSTRFLKTNRFVLNVESVISDSTQTIADIADPLSVGLGFWDFAFPLLLIAAIIFGIAILVRYLNKRKENIPVYEVNDDRPPYLIVLEELEKLKKEKLLDKGEFLQFHFQLSMLLRLFIELQFRVTAVEMTTSEIRSSLVMEDFREKSQIVEFLTFADKVKFAKFIPKLAESENAMKWLEEYLKSYKYKEAIEVKNEELNEKKKEQENA